ncbi:Protein CBG16121 [Caenorhabditis briggsae]|uniref:Protein CBG16121 n=1 Tax=Caenorhabditis briggsae TaxID=6238 RepID=A8XP24_CAEBR|nr:Protein CBG16121 [Caenorhabditis briggsae]CAP34264.1 Protein CBG16121 [Caenorhabditis briggsae]
MYNRSFRVPKRLDTVTIPMFGSERLPSTRSERCLPRITTAFVSDCSDMQCLSPNRERNNANPRLVRGRIVYKSKRTLHRVDAQTPSRDSSLYAQPPARRHLSQPAREGSLRACRSHESLLSSAHSTHMIELDNENCLHPIHASIMDVPNCFRMQQTYYACRSQNERAKWMEHLTKLPYCELCLAAFRLSIIRKSTRPRFIFLLFSSSRFE